jgi:hypothetical protein
MLFLERLPTDGDSQARRYLRQRCVWLMMQCRRRGLQDFASPGNLQGWYEIVNAEVESRALLDPSSPKNDQRLEHEALKDVNLCEPPSLSLLFEDSSMQRRHYRFRVPFTQGSVRSPGSHCWK